MTYDYTRPDLIDWEEHCANCDPHCYCSTVNLGFMTIEDISDHEMREDMLQYSRKYFSKWDNLEDGECYVYVARDGDNVVYIGSGKKDRYKHVSSGISHNKELNRLFFAGTKLNTFIVKDSLSKGAAEKLEKFLVKFYVPSANENMKPNDSYIRNYGSWYFAYTEGKMSHDTFMKLVNNFSNDPY